jgi:predicted dienelactone hydrolase
VDGLTRLILLSHGTGASGRDLAWLAEPLAQAGFLVAAVDHHGNNWVDGYAAPGFVFVWERPADLRHVLHLIQRHRRVDWVGAAGFSAGGYAAAALVGVRLDPDLIRLLAEGEIPDPPLPEFPSAFEWLRRTTTTDTIGDLMESAGGDQSDDRVQAAFLICPGDGGMSSAASLREVTRPVEIRWADADVITRPEQTALRYLELIGGAHGRSLGRHVEHHHLFPDDIKGTDVRRRAGADAVAFLAQASGLKQPS